MGFSNAPGAPKAIYGQAFFPLSRPVEVAEGDRADLALRAHLVDDDYVWHWRTRITATDGKEKARFDQSTFRGTPRDLEALRRGAESFAPRLADKGAATHAALAAMDVATPLGDIAARLHRDFPTHFPTRQAAFRHVAALSQQYAG